MTIKESKMTQKDCEAAVLVLEAAAKILRAHGNNGDAARLLAVADTWEEYYGKP